MDKQENKPENENKSIPPMTNEHLYVITELAKIGLDFLKSQLGVMKKSIEDGKSKLTMDNYKHYEGLANIAGPETVSHFDRICQYIYETSMKAAAKKAEEKKGEEKKE